MCIRVIKSIPQTSADVAVGTFCVCVFFSEYWKRAALQRRGRAVTMQMYSAFLRSHIDFTARADVLLGL